MNIEKLSRFDRVMVTLCASPAQFILCGICAGAAFSFVLANQFWFAAGEIVVMCLCWHNGTKRLASEYHSAGHMAVNIFVRGMAKKAVQFIEEHRDEIINDLKGKE